MRNGVTARNPSRTTPKASDVNVEVWEERDRLHIQAVHKQTGVTIAEWWDDDARSMFEDGFFRRGRELKPSVVAYLQDMRLVNPPGKRVWPAGEQPAEHLRNALMLLDDVLPYGDDSRASLRAATERIERALFLLDPKALPGRGRNPILALVNSDGLRVERVGVKDRGRVMGTGVYAIAYKHADDGADYEHEFEKWDKVKLRVLNDRAVLLFSDTVDIIGMFTADDD